MQSISRHRIVLASIPLFGAFIVGACGGTEADAGAQAFPPSPVVLAAVEQTEIQDATEYVGYLKSLRSTPIQSQVDGRITAIRVRPGDRVSAGQPLVEIDPAEQRATVSSTEADLAAQEAEVELARQEAVRNRELRAAGLVSQQELDRTEAALKAAESELESLRAQIEQGQVRLQYFTVTAPIDGVVGDVPVRVGEQITAQTLLTTVADNRSLELNVPVPVERSRDLETGLPLEVLGPDGDPLITTTVSFISPTVDERTQSVLVKGLVRPDDAALRSDQQVRVRVVWSAAPGLTVPILSVIRLNDQRFVFVAEERDGQLTASQRSIEVGPMLGNSYVVLEGLEAGERIVTSGIQRVRDGAPIAPQS